MLYKTKILSSDLSEIMKSKDDKCTTEGVHEQCDNNIYKLASRMPFCHIRSNKDFNPNYSENAAGNLVDVTYIHDHVKNIICDNNEELYKYILSWFSYKIQVPKGKTGIALVITEAEGSRKMFSLIFYVIFLELMLIATLIILKIL